MNRLTNNFKHLKYAAAFLLCAAALPSVSAQEKKLQPGIFYAVTGNGLTDTSWLFGTYHLVNSSYLDGLPAVQKAFDQSKGLVVEVVVDSTKLAAAQSIGMLKDKTLSGLLDKAFADSLDEELKNNIGVGVAQLNQLKPMNVTLTLSIVYLMKNNGGKLQQYTGLPLDVHFAAQAKQQQKNITALETLEGQMDLLFNRSSDEAQAAQLKTFLRNKTEMIKLGDELMEQWFAHDLDKMFALYNSTLELSGETDYLIRERNDSWMKRLPALLAKEPQFIATGALHLAGPHGLVNQLKQLGYTVTAVKL
jgi:hypothetical protein